MSCNKHDTSITIFDEISHVYIAFSTIKLAGLQHNLTFQKVVTF